MNRLNFNVAIIIHLYYTDLWEEFSSKLKKLNTSYDLYITICDDSANISDTILNEFPNAKILVVKNKGLDVGPFLLVMKSILSNNIHYDYIVKLHTKKCLHHIQPPQFGINWRTKLLNALIGSDEKFYDVLKILNGNEYGMATASEYIFDEKTIDWMSDLLESVEITITPQTNKFAAGTMFIAKFNIFRDFLNAIDIDTLYELTTDGYVRDGAIEHKLERLFGFIVQTSGYKILGIN